MASLPLIRSGRDIAFSFDRCADGWMKCTDVHHRSVCTITYSGDPLAAKSTPQLLDNSLNKSRYLANLGIIVEGSHV